MSKPDVLVVVWDTVRRDALEPYGAPAGATPVAADLARRGVMAPAARATTCWTMPSHVSMFAGVLPRDVGLSQAPGGTPAGCRAGMEALQERLLPEVFRRAGYRTAAASGNLWIDRPAGFDLGFDEFEAHTGHRTAAMGRSDLRGQLEWLAHAARARADDGAEDLLATLKRQGESADARPRFTFVNIADAHSPYLPPRPYAAPMLQRLRAAREASRHLTLQAIWATCAGRDLPPAGALGRMREQYAGEVRYTDAWMGRVLEHLQASGRLDETLVVLTSDHGENFGENGFMAHAFSLDERLVHIPLIAAGPGAERLADVRTLADLPLALCEAVGIEGHPYESLAPDGIAIAQFDPPRPDDPARVDHFLEVTGLAGDERARARLTEPLTMAVRGGLKLLRRGDREELYDLAADPGELAPQDPATGDASEVAALRAALERGMQSAPAATAPVTASAEEIADIEERMAMLGYM